MSSRSRVSVTPEGDAGRALLESLIREEFERSYPGMTFEELKRRASFSKEAKGLYRDWLATAAARAAFASIPLDGPGK